MLLLDRWLAALVCYCEASSASAQERRCVMVSFFNRLRRGRFGKTIASVCLQRYQYSSLNDDKRDNANLLRGAEAKSDDKVFLDCLDAFDEVASPSYQDPTHGATHYHDKTLEEKPSWALVPAVMSLETAKFFFYKDVP